MGIKQPLVLGVYSQTFLSQVVSHLNFSGVIYLYVYLCAIKEQAKVFFGIHAVCVCVYVHAPRQTHTLCSQFLLSTCVAVLGSEEGGECQGKLLTQLSQVE